MDRVTQTRKNTVRAASVLAWMVFSTSCVLDLDGLTTPGGGGTAGEGGTGAGGQTTSSQGGGGGGAGCPLLECCPEGQVVTLADGPVFADLPRGLVLRGDSIVWTAFGGGDIVWMKAEGGPPEVLLEAASPRSIATASDVLAWTAADGVYTCFLPDCAVSAQLVTPALAMGSLRGVAFDGETLVFVDRGAGEGDGRARSCDLADCNPIDLQDSMIAPEDAVIADGVAFWNDVGSGNMNGTIGRSPKGAADYTQIAAARSLPTGIAVDETYVYWTEELPEGHVYRCPFAAGYCDAPEDIVPAAGPLGRPSDIQIGGGRIYWTSLDDGSIVSCPQPGCGDAMPKVHVTGRTGLSRLAVGSYCLFWTENSGGGAVLKTAR